jgi:hypothetical protein
MKTWIALVAFVSLVTTVGLVQSKNTVQQRSGSITTSLWLSPELQDHLTLPPAVEAVWPEEDLYSGSSFTHHVWTLPFGGGKLMNDPQLDEVIADLEKDTGDKIVIRRLTLAPKFAVSYLTERIID